MEEAANFARDSGSALSKNKFQCSICLDVLTDPVTTACGHNFCKTCLTQYWNRSQDCHCPFCKERFFRRPQLKTNETLRDVVDQFKKKGSLNEPEVFCDFCTGDMQKALKSCLDCGASFCKTHLEPHKVAKLKTHKLIDPVKNLKVHVCHKHERPLELFCRVDQTYVCQFCLEREHKCHITVPIVQEIREKKSLDLREMQQYAVDVTLDRDTAYPNLILSADGKKVTYGDRRLDVPDTPKRFDKYANILAKKGFSSGRFYFEAQVRGKTKWDVGVARESINRKGIITLSPGTGYWAVVLRNGNQYEARDSPPHPLYLRQQLQKVGVFVDYEEGLVSFYDVEARSHIYSFTGQYFTEKLYPYFSPRNNKEGNSAPLIISQVCG